MRAPLEVLAVDDEVPALDDLAGLLRSFPEVGEVTTVASGPGAIRCLAERRFAAVFLDVRMPGLDGLELGAVLHRFETPPALVFVSGYEDAAVHAFELKALDYLVKPVRRSRLAEAIDRVLEVVGATEWEEAGDVVPVATARGARRLVARASILYLHARGDYVRLVSDDGRFLLRERISELERRWAPFGFVRVHRGYIANMHRAVEVRPRLNGTAVLAFPNGTEIPVARRKAAQLKRELAAGEGLGLEGLRSHA